MTAFAFVVSGKDDQGFRIIRRVVAQSEGAARAYALAHRGLHTVDSVTYSVRQVGVPMPTRRKEHGNRGRQGRRTAHVS